MNKIIISLMVATLILTGCKKEWEEHYNDIPVTVNRNMWEVIKEDPELSAFVAHMEAFEFDTLFKEAGGTYTMFIPNNDAFELYEINDTVNQSVLNYHISAHFVQSGNVKKSDKVQMLGEKYVRIEHSNNTTIFDGIPLEFESPLYLNGKFYVMSEVAYPKSNLFEYYAVTNPILKKYILGLDSIIVDKELSRPIGFDDQDRTIYDTVAIIYNEFEDEYFPVREEFRFKSATVVFPKAEDYNAALDVMAGSLGEVYQDHADIPLDWQNEILIPYLLEHGVFENSLASSAFIQTSLPRDSLKLKNILGDSIIINYRVADRFECSNGVAFNYENFSIPDTLFNGSIRIEMEQYLEKLGKSRFAWKPDLVTVASDKTFSPLGDSIPTASNDSIMRVLFDPGYTGNYSVEFKIDNLFPRKYLMVVRTNINYGGVYDVYLNDQLIRTMDYHDYYLADYRWYYYSVTGSRYFPQEQGYHKWDAWAINEQPYGKATLRFEYRGPSALVSPALLIDYIDFIPWNE